MKAINFKKANVMIAKDQNEYETLPVYYNNEDGAVCYGFKLDPAEIKKIVKTGEIWLRQLTNGEAMQPILISITKEDALILTEEDKKKYLKK